MNNIQCVIFTVIGIFCFTTTNAEISAVCKRSSDCPDSGQYCTKGFCDCRKTIYYNEDGSAFCKSYSFDGLCFSTLYPCNENEKCDEGKCKCMDGFYTVGGKCVKAKMADLWEPCGHNVLTEKVLCDISKHYVCSARKCLCAYGFVPTPDGECQLQSSYISLNNLAEYRVKPGEYCRKDEECIQGLQCKNLNCSCPSYCTYDKTKETCDCGEVETSAAPIVVGCGLGLLIILFWYYTIKSTIKRHKKMERFSPAPVDTEPPASYPLSPVTQTTSDVNPSTIGLQFESSPHKQEGFSVPKERDSFLPKSPLPYSLNASVSPPSGSTMVNPPASSELGPPPPYSCDPPVSIMPPYSPSSTPYAVSPNHSNFPEASTFPPQGPAQYDLQPAYNPYYTEGSSTGLAENGSKFNKKD